MLHKTTIVLAITLVIGSLSAARAEDPDENVVERFHAAVPHWQAELRHHVMRFSGPQWLHYTN